MYTSSRLPSLPWNGFVDSSNGRAFLKCDLEIGEAAKTPTFFLKKRASQGARDLTRLVECCSPMQETLVPSPDHINQGCESHL